MATLFARRHFRQRANAHTGPVVGPFPGTTYRRRRSKRAVPGDARPLSLDEGFRLYAMGMEDPEGNEFDIN